MDNKCILCGEQLNELGICPNISQHFKQMCLNCSYYKNVDNSYCICTNEDNKMDAIDKIRASFDGGYTIVDINLEPLPLREPTRKCKRYAINTEAIVSSFNAF